jgi:acyl carrier protein
MSNAYAQVLAETPAAETSQILSWLVQKFGEWMEIDPRELDASRPISSYGLDSISAVTLSVYLEEELGIQLETAVLWDHPTLESLAAHLWQEMSRQGVKELPCAAA